MSSLHRTAIYAATCASITVSGTRDLDGTYEEGAAAGDPFVRAEDTITYEIYEVSVFLRCPRLVHLGRQFSCVQGE